MGDEFLPGNASRHLNGSVDGKEEQELLLWLRNGPNKKGKYFL